MNTEAVILKFQPQSEQQILPEGMADIIDVSDIEGTKGYCSKESQEKITIRIGSVCQGIRFLGSGNYHYAALFFLRKIADPFQLIVIDHHTDMQPSLFPELLSCGSWIYQALTEISNLKQVLLFGVEEEYVEELGEYDTQRIHFFTKQMLSGKESDVLAKAGRLMEGKCYISIDKDALSEDVVMTDWDQGDMSRETLYRILELVKRCHTECIGIDVCGESAVESRVIQSQSAGEGRVSNQEWNEGLLGELRTLFQ